MKRGLITKMKLNFLAVGDIHLEALARYLPESDYLSPVIKTLEQIWEYAKDNGIEHIVLLGDIFDNPYPKDDKSKELEEEFEMPLKYYGFFSSQEKSLKEGYFKSLFTKSRVFTFDLNIIPEYEVKNGKLIVKTKLEEF